MTQDERLLRPALKPASESARPALEALPLASELNVDAEIAFVEQYLRRYVGADERALDPLREIQRRVRERQAETRLFLGVVGEFSSGKSTLVNALVRKKLLRTDVLQGTTAAATLLRSGDRLDVQIRRRRGNLAQRTWNSMTRGANLVKGLFGGAAPPPTPDDLLHLIHRATSEEEFAKDIVQVDVTLPSPKLHGGLVIVDTPGTNATNPRHALVTEGALRDLCDAALVAVPAEAAGSESLFAFLEKHAADLIHRCVFVVTKIDLIRREKDRERVLQNLRARISQQFGISNPRVLACAPQLVVESLDPASEGEFSHDEIRVWTEHFERMEAELDGTLRLRRLQAQTDDVVQMAMQLISHLQTILNQRRNEYLQRHQALEQSVLPDVDRFVAERVESRRSSCSQALAKIYRETDRDIEAAAGSLLAEIARAVNGAENRGALQHAVEKKIPAIYVSGQRQLTAIMQRALQVTSQAAGWELNVFHEEFQQHFRALATLGGRLDGTGLDVRALSQVSAARGTAASSEFARELRGVAQGQAAASVGMAAGGAVIGTFIFPGLGTVLGALAGGALSMLFGPSLDELKAKCWSQLEPEVTAGLQAFLLDARTSLRASHEATLVQLGSTIDSYLPRYKELVRIMRQRDEAEKKQLAEFRRLVEADLETVEKRRASLDDLRRRLRDL